MEVILGIRSGGDRKGFYVKTRTECGTGDKFWETTGRDDSLILKIITNFPGRFRTRHE